MQVSEDELAAYGIDDTSDTQLLFDVLAHRRFVQQIEAQGLHVVEVTVLFDNIAHVYISICSFSINLVFSSCACYK